MRRILNCFLWEISKVNSQYQRYMIKLLNLIAIKKRKQNKKEICLDKLRSLRRHLKFKVTPAKVRLLEERIWRKMIRHLFLVINPVTLKEDNSSKTPRWIVKIQLLWVITKKTLCNSKWIKNVTIKWIARIQFKIQFQMQILTWTNLRTESENWD